MTTEMILTLVILLVSIVLFVSEKVRLDVVALGVAIALMVTGIVTLPEGLAGFSNNAVISVAALFVVGAAVFQTGLAGAIAERILRAAGGSSLRLLVILMLAVGVLSGFVGSTGMVALMLPAIVTLARQANTRPSRLLIPMSYAALIGGASTLIGTPPNLLASQALEEAGFAPFSLFSFAPIGLLLLVTAILYMTLIGRRWLPDHAPQAQVQSAHTPGDLFRIYELPGSLFRLRIQDSSPLVGQTLAQSRLREAYDLNLIALLQDPDARRLSFMRPDPTESYSPKPDTLLAVDDVLLVQADPDALGRVTAELKLAIVFGNPVEAEDLITSEVGIAEVLLRPRSSLVGRTLEEVRFGSTYRLTVLDIKRPTEAHLARIKDAPLKFGDVLLVQGEWQDIFALKRLRQDFIVMGEREAVELGAFTQPEKAPITMIVLVGMIALVGLNILPLAVASLLAAVLLVLTGCLTMDEAYAGLDMKSLVLMAGMLPMGTALEKVGLVSLVAEALVASLGQAGPLAVMAGLYLLAALLTQVLSNTATVVLLAPLALAAAQGLGVRPEAFVMTTAMASSMAFATPLASPVVTMVVSAGGYRFNDFLRLGMPLLLLTMIVTLLVIPLLWPF